MRSRRGGATTTGTPSHRTGVLVQSEVIFGSYAKAQPPPASSDILAMSNVSDLTLDVLKDIRADLRELRAEQRVTNERLEDTNKRLDVLTEATRVGFAGVHQRIDGVSQRIDSVLKIVGGHHTELESRVKRLEDHLGLPHEH